MNLMEMKKKMNNYVQKDFNNKYLEQTQTTNMSLSVGHTAHKDVYTVFETVTGNDEPKPIHTFKTPKGAFDKIFNDKEISE